LLDASEDGKHGHFSGDKNITKVVKTLEKGGKAIGKLFK
jgi:hypothetical protein